ncbi:hypothetical protein [uncultured Enterovirga sp.]|uniref:hypothetical protein n=1 Tax=uncultured Enterovirga sp. TaxID=2026352 RepID=UPI0035CA9D5A
MSDAPIPLALDPVLVQAQLDEVVRQRDVAQARLVEGAVIFARVSRERDVMQKVAERLDADNVTLRARLKDLGEDPPETPALPAPVKPLAPAGAAETVTAH